MSPRTKVFVGEFYQSKTSPAEFPACHFEHERKSLRHSDLKGWARSMCCVTAVAPSWFAGPISLVLSKLSSIVERPTPFRHTLTATCANRRASLLGVIHLLTFGVLGKKHCASSPGSSQEEPKGQMTRLSAIT